MTTPSSHAKRLARYQAELKQLAAHFADIGFIYPGSLVQRYTTCGNPDCRCQADPPQLHGPYWQWSKAVAGKTVSRTVTDNQVPLYQAWIANRRRLPYHHHRPDGTSLPTSDRDPLQTRLGWSHPRSAIQPKALRLNDPMLLLSGGSS
jgi:hypothetical protein